MTEFTQGIQGAFKKILTGSSLTLAGASLWEAGAVALVEPSINGVWFYILHSGWKKLKGIS